MSGKKGRSGRLPRLIEENCRKNIDKIEIKGKGLPQIAMVSAARKYTG